MIITNYSWGTDSQLFMQIGLFGTFSLERSAEVSSGGVTSRRCSFMKKVHDSSTARGTTSRLA